MAEYDDYFPSRVGQAIGSAKERAMLDAAQGAGGIRTQMRLEGNRTTRLRTRGGNPEFYVEEGGGAEEELPICALIPVSNDAPWGFNSAGPFTYGLESSPASAEVDVGATRLRYYFNERHVTNASRSRLHPGNRTWVDHRAERTTGKVVSWWCPFNTALPLSFTWYDPDRPWLGNAGVTAEMTSRAQEGRDLFGTWDNCKGFVFINGRKVCDFGEHVWAAAWDEANQRVLAVTTVTIELDSGAMVKTTAFKLRAFDRAAGTYSLLATLGGGWLGEYRAPMPVFSPDAAELLIALNIPAADDSTLYRVAMDGTATLVSPLVSSSSGPTTTTRIVAARYADDGVSLLYAKERAITYAAGSYGYTVEIEGVEVAADAGYYSTFAYTDGGEFYSGHDAGLTGTLCRVVAADGRGGYLLGYLPEFSRTYREFQTPSGSTINYTFTHPSADFTRYTTPGGAMPRNTVDLPLRFMRAGQAVADWATLPNVTLPLEITANNMGGYCISSFPKTMLNRWVTGFSNEAPLGGPNLRQLSVSLAVSPNGRKDIVGARMVGGTTNVQEASGPVYMYDVYASKSGFMLVSDGVATPITPPWGGTLVGMNSPVFFARRGERVEVP